MSLDDLRRTYPANFTVVKYEGRTLLYDGELLVAQLYEDSYAKVLTEAPTYIQECVQLAGLLKNYRATVERLAEIETELSQLRQQVNGERTPY
jgi:hypothetical protein